MEQSLEFRMTNSHISQPEMIMSRKIVVGAKCVTPVIHIISIFNLKWSIHHNTILSLHVCNLSKSQFYRSMFI